MMMTSTNKVLKEWASVCEALATGQQIILFRKGGIIEQHDCFEVESPEFFLYPTYLHQKTDDLQPQFQHLIPETETARVDEKHVKLSYYATVEHVVEAKNIDRLRTMDSAYIWTPEYVERAWSWAPHKPAYILFLRAYKLETPHVIEDRLEYGGCVSWVDLVEPLDVGKMTPVLGEREFEAQKHNILETLADSVMAGTLG